MSDPNMNEKQSSAGHSGAFDVVEKRLIHHLTNKNERNKLFLRK